MGDAHVRAGVVGQAVLSGRARVAMAVLAVPLLAAGLSRQSLAATYYWDTNPNTVAAGNDVTEGGAGTWNTTTANFTLSSTDAAATNHNVWSSVLNSAGTDTVIFGGTAGGAITLNSFATGGQITGSTSLGITNLTFKTNGYTLSGSNQIRFISGSGAITIDPGITATISNVITGGGVSGYTVDTNVDINGGGTLRLGGYNNSLGFTIASGTTVELLSGSMLSGWNSNTVNGTLRPMASWLIPGQSPLAGSGVLDLNGTSQAVAALSGSFGVTNQTSTGNSTLNVTLTTNTASYTHTGSISNGTGKVSLAFTGTTAQGGGFTNGNVGVTQVMAGTNTYTGSTSIGRGTLSLDFSNAAAPATNILYNSGFGATPTGNDGQLIISRATDTVGGVANSPSGTQATLILTGKASATNSQAFNGLTLNANSSAQVLINPNATANTVTLDLGSTFTRNTGSLINFSTTNATTALAAGAMVKASAGTADSILLDAGGVAFATLGGRDWAAKNAANDTVVAVTYTNSTTTTLSGNATTLGGAGNDVRLAADTTITSLRYGSSNRSAINIGGNTLTTGGILASASLGSGSGGYLSGGTVKPAGSDLVIVNYGAFSSLFGLGATVANGASGPTGLTTGGNSITLLTGNNTYTGTLSVQQGGLIVMGSNTPSNVVVNGSTTNLMGSHLPGSNATTGNFLQLGNADTSGSIGSGTIELGLNSILAIKRSDAVTLDNTIRGTGGVTQGWSGTTTMLSAATPKYTYVGDTTVTAGTLKLDYGASNTKILNNSSGAGSQLVLGGGTVELATTATTTINEDVRQTTLITGASTITKTGAGTGRLRLNTFAGYGAGSTLNFAAASIADTDATNSNGILSSRLTVGSADWAVNSINGGDGAVTAYTAYSALNTAAGTDTANSLLSNSGATLAGSRITNTLKIANTSGSVQSIDIGAANTLTLTANAMLVTGSDAVQINNGTLKPSGTELIIHQYDSAGLTIGSAIANGSGTTALTKTGSGSLTLTAANTYTGTTYITGGTLVISSNTNLGPAATSAGIHLNNGTLRATDDIVLAPGAAGTTDRSVTVSGIGGTFEVDAGKTLTMWGWLSGPAGLTKTGDGILNVGNQANTGPTIINAGTLRIGRNYGNTAMSPYIVASGATFEVPDGRTIGSLEGDGTVMVGSTAAGDRWLYVGARQNNTTFGGRLTNGNATYKLAFEKIGAGTLTLTGANNDHTGGTTISGGTLALAGDGALPATGGLSISSAAGTFDISAISGTTSTIGSLSGATGSSIVLGAKTLAFGTASNSTFSGSISGTGGITKNGTGLFTIGGANTYSGATTISGGRIALSGAGNLSSTTPLNISSATGIFDISGISGTTATVGSLAGVSGSSVVLGAKTLSTGGSDNATFAGIISGTGGLTKTGAGVQTLTGANSYTGPTTITGGTLLINGNQSSATGTITVGADGAIGGSGTVGGATTIGGVHSPGNSPGRQTFAGNLAYDSTAHFAFELTANSSANRGTEFDAVDVGGNLTIASGAAIDIAVNGLGSSVNFADAFWSAEQSWLVIDSTGAGTTSGNFTLGAVSVDSLAHSYDLYGTFQTTVTNGDVYLSWAPVPEPGIASLLMLNVGMLLLERRRRRED